MLTPEDKEKFKSLLDDWCEVQDRKKELSTEAKTLAEEGAKILETKPAKIAKIFKILKQKMDSAEDELSELQDLIDEVSD